MYKLHKMSTKLFDFFSSQIVDVSEIIGLEDSRSRDKINSEQNISFDEDEVDMTPVTPNDSVDPFWS